MRNGENFFGETGNAAEVAHFGSTDLVQTRASIERLAHETKTSLEREGRAERFRLNVIPALRNGIQPYANFPKSLGIARNIQEAGSDPYNPKQPYAKALRSRVQDLLQAKHPFVTRVAFFTACSPVSINGVHIRLTADQYHSTDAFLDIYDNDPSRPDKRYPERRSTITIDGTINPHKADDQNSKANIVTLFPPDLSPTLDPQGFNRFVEEEAQKVVEHYGVIHGKRTRSGTA